MAPSPTRKTSHHNKGSWYAAYFEFAVSLLLSTSHEKFLTTHRVDDVEDSSLLRRGEPVAHNIFGVPQSINSANYVYFLALQELSTLQNPTCIQIFTEELINLHRGQGMDLFWRDTLTCPTEDDYLEMVNNKTGGLFRLAIKLMEAESHTFSNPQATGGAEASASQATITPSSSRTRSCVPLINAIGLLFQVLDDLLNLSSPAYTARKGLAEDLTEGKFSFPVIHAIRSDTSNLVLINILRQKTTDHEVKRYAIEYMERVGSFEYTRKAIRELERKALKEVELLEGVIQGGARGAEKIRAILAKLKTF
jgi:geranylgeranyl diphosphate synthase type 3